MIKIFLTISLVISIGVAKVCYFNKVKKVCYYKYFATYKIYDAKSNEDYYVSNNRSIYAFTDLIGVRFNTIGAVFDIRNNFDVEFYDKTDKGIYQFKVKDKQDLFAIVSKMNELKSVMKAWPVKKRKYTKQHMAYIKEAKRKRVEQMLKRGEKELKNNKKPKKRSKLSGAKLENISLKNKK